MKSSSASQYIHCIESYTLLSHFIDFLQVVFGAMYHMHSIDLHSSASQYSSSQHQELVSTPSITKVHICTTTYAPNNNAFRTSLQFSLSLTIFDTNTLQSSLLKNSPPTETRLQRTFSTNSSSPSPASKRPSTNT